MKIQRTPFVLFLVLTLFDTLNSHAQQAGELWGMTYSGGQNSMGVIFKTAPDGSGYAAQYYFSTQYPGARPSFPPIIASNGKLYGLAGGGTHSQGVLFEYDRATHIYTKKQDFDQTVDGAYPTGTLTLASNGKLYGTTSQELTGKGLLFEFDFTTGTFTKKFDFDGTTSGDSPVGSLTAATNGKLYGATAYGGASGNGVLFVYDPSTNTYTKEMDFDGAGKGASPVRLIQVSTGELYGMTNGGGANGLGVLFKYDIGTHTYTKQLDFSGTANGSNPNDGLREAANGRLYGTTRLGGANGVGVLFEFDPSNNNFVKKLDFNLSSVGGNPSGGLLQIASGKLYGMTTWGGANGNGVLYEYDPSNGNYVKRLEFDGVAKGAAPLGSLIQASDGKLLGTTQTGGANSDGILFEFDVATGIYTKDFDFDLAPNGSNPFSSLTLGANGKLYGATSTGGAKGYGVLFEYDPSSATYLKKFDFSGTDGSSPRGQLIEANGKFYGLTFQGGANFDGVLFEYDLLTNTYTKKFEFSADAGNSPFGALLKASNGKLYGMTLYGGANNQGVLFEFDLSTGIYKKKFEFDGALHGSLPRGSLIEASEGLLYGMTYSGGANNQGVLFRYDILSDVFAKKIDFNSGGPFSPEGDLTKGMDGNLYGLTEGGGNGSGLLFKYDTVANLITSEINFGAGNGTSPQGTMTLGPNGKLYGMANAGGANAAGTVFEYDPATNIFITKSDLILANGAYPSFGKLIILKASQQITFNALANKTYGDAPFSLSATASSGLAVTWTSSDTTIAKLSGSTVTILKGGSVTITASQAGNATYLAAPIVVQTLTINKLGQLITFDGISTKTVGDAAFTLSAMASSSLGVNYVSSSGKATVNGNLITLVLAGRDTITASQPGNDFYAAAATESQTFCINPAKPAITVSHDGTGSPVLTSSAAVGNQWYLDGTAITGQTATTITLVQSGTYKVQATVNDCVGSFSDDVPEVVTGDLNFPKERLSVYPNPSNDLIVLSGSTQDVIDASVVDVLGGATSLKLEKQQDRITADIHALSSGLYIIRISTLSGPQQLKFIKQ